jgi:hypothetical protein
VLLVFHSSSCLGFAVVATEIKALAQQTVAATEDIRSRIASVLARCVRCYRCDSLRSTCSSFAKLDLEIMVEGAPNHRLRTPVRPLVKPTERNCDFTRHGS